MKSEYINPFLESARIVIEQVVNVRPTMGKLSVKDVKLIKDYIWIQIGLTGQMRGDIVFGLHESVALKIISAMMGGFIMTEINEIGQSAISELGNMISGNASTILYSQGVRVDITPPKIIHAVDSQKLESMKAITIPLIMEGIGEMDIQVLIA